MATWRIGDWIVGEWQTGRLELLRYVGREAWVRIPDRFSETAAIRQNDELQQPVTGAVEGRVVAIGNGAFRNCGHMLGVVVPEGVLLLGANAFENCRALQTVHLPDSVQRIGERCFSGCESLETVWLPECVSALNEGVFAGCARLSAINLQFVERIGAEAFSGCRLLGESCVNRAALRRERMGAGAFRGCEALADEEGFAVIDGVLTGCYVQDAEVEVPEGVRVLDRGCFSALPNLTGLILPDSLREIRGGALDGCPALRRVVAPGAVTRIGNLDYDADIDFLSDHPIAFERDEIDWHPFSVKGPGSFLVRGMQSILPQNRYAMRFRLEDGEITVLRYLGSAAQPRIPDVWKGYPVTKIGPYAFAGLEVTRVVLPKFLREIGVGAFAGDEQLRGLVTDARLRRVGAYAFTGCAGLTGVAFEEGLERVDEGAFAGCASMRYALLPRSVSHLAEDAFDPGVLLAGAKDSYVQQFAGRLRREFLDAADADALAGRVVMDRYADYHMFVSGDQSGNNRWAFGGDVEGV
ncbi:MAG: leucine-rich repeat protein [Clostridia bacterium]|nr:leucine-rich repeat protein [Clostridia bacterium]